MDSSAVFCIIALKSTLITPVPREMTVSPPDSHVIMLNFRKEVFHHAPYVTPPAKKQCGPGSARAARGGVLSRPDERSIVNKKRGRQNVLDTLVFTRDTCLRARGKALERVVLVEDDDAADAYPIRTIERRKHLRGYSR